MGKIRLKTLGDDEQEQLDVAVAQKRRAVKKEKKGEVVADKAETVVSEKAPKKVKAPKKEAVVIEEGVEVEKEVVEVADEKAVEAPVETKKSSTSKKGKSSKKVFGKNALKAQKLTDRTKKVSIDEAVKLLKTMKYAKFDETVEVHINIKETGLKGDVILPHGTGKDVRAVIADEKVLKEISEGIFNFDILITTPGFMSQLVPFARVLGPKGLMPNPKIGTVTDKPEEAMKKFKGGTVNFKSEPKSPIIHQAVGKMSFQDAQLVENISAFLGAITKKNIVSAYISGTMTPSVQIEVA